MEDKYNVRPILSWHKILIISQGENNVNLFECNLNISVIRFYT